MNREAAVIACVVAALIAAVMLFGLSRSAENYKESSLNGQVSSGLGNAPAGPSEDGDAGAGSAPLMLAKAADMRETASFAGPDAKNSTLSGVFSDGEGIEPPGMPI